MIITFLYLASLIFKKNIFMKNLLKLGLAVLGIVSATVASSSSLFAKQQQDQPCHPTGLVYGTTSGGTTLQGTWVE